MEKVSFDNDLSPFSRLRPHLWQLYIDDNNVNDLPKLDSFGQLFHEMRDTGKLAKLEKRD